MINYQHTNTTPTRREALAKERAARRDALAITAALAVLIAVSVLLPTLDKIL